MDIYALTVECSWRDLTTGPGCIGEKRDVIRVCSAVVGFLQKKKKIVLGKQVSRQGGKVPPVSK
jgi:hypothetical protein